MECLMSGNTTLSLTEFNDCNKTPSKKSNISKKCCDFNDITLDFDYDSNINLKNFEANTSTAIILQNNLILLAPVVKTFNFNNYTNLPPPGGYELIKIVQNFRI